MWQPLESEIRCEQGVVRLTWGVVMGEVVLVFALVTRYTCRELKAVIPVFVFFRCYPTRTNLCFRSDDTLFCTAAGSCEILYVLF